MIEYRLNEKGVLEEVETELNTNTEIMQEISFTEDKTSEVPVERGFWSKFKGFLFQEINVKDFLFQEIQLFGNKNQENENLDTAKRGFFHLELTPYEKKVFREVKEFWTQDVFKEIKF